VVLHLEPRVEAGRLQSNTARTQLLLEHEPLPWTRWGEEFAASMPAEILRLQERAASADSVPRREAIRNRVTPILALYRLSRYRATRQSTQTSARSKVGSTTGGRASRAAVDGEASGAPSADGVRSVSDIDDVRGRVGGQDPGNEPCPAPTLDLPNVAWISARDGSRAPGDLEDQAARYHPARHELTINADFRAISDLITHRQDRYKGVPGARAVIEAHVREWCEQILVEVVLAARASTWSAEQLGALLSPTAFTVVLLPRHLLYAILQKRLAQKLGPPHRGHPMSHETPDPARRLSHELELPTVRARKALVRVVESAGEFAVVREREVDLLTLAERRDLANALPRATWIAGLAKTRVLLLDFLTATAAAAIRQARR
jgi:hypothetical protein